MIYLFLVKKLGNPREIAMPCENRKKKTFGAQPRTTGIIGVFTHDSTELLNCSNIGVFTNSITNYYSSALLNPRRLVCVNLHFQVTDSSIPNKLSNLAELDLYIFVLETSAKKKKNHQ